MRLVHEIVVPKRDDFFQVVRQKLSSDIETPYCSVERLPVIDGCDGGVGIAGVDDEAAFDR
jgi:hypothetical protein